MELFSIQSGIVAVAIGGVIFYAVSVRRRNDLKKTKEQGFIKEMPKKKQKSHKKLLDTFEMV